MKKAPPEVAVISPEERLRLFAALPLRVRLVAETLYECLIDRARRSAVPPVFRWVRWLRA